MLLLVQRRRLGGLQLQMMLLGGWVVGSRSVYGGGGAPRELLILATLVLTGMKRVVMVGVRMRMRVRRAPGVTLLPGGGRVRTGHLLSLFVSHSRPAAGIHSGFDSIFPLFLIGCKMR